MVRIYIKDNTTGIIHEYGTDPHDALILMEDGSLHYENLHNCAGTEFPEEGFSFCLEDGTIPKFDEDRGCEPYLNIGGEYYRTPHETNEELRNKLIEGGIL